MLKESEKWKERERESEKVKRKWKGKKKGKWKGKNRIRETKYPTKKLKIRQGRIYIIEKTSIQFWD